MHVTEKINLNFEKKMLGGIKKIIILMMNMIIVLIY
jgi:hypothetical protein